MGHYIRMDFSVAAPGIMRRALTLACHHVRNRSAFGHRIADLPQMKNVLADLALESEASLLLGMQMAAALDNEQHAELAHSLRLQRTAAEAGRHDLEPDDDGACGRIPLRRDPRKHRTVALAVTTNLAFNFLRKPDRADLIGECRLFKRGKSLAVGEVAIRTDWGAQSIRVPTDLL
jgi:hypothetical protein